MIHPYTQFHIPRNFRACYSLTWDSAQLQGDERENFNSSGWVPGMATGAISLYFFSSWANWVLKIKPRNVSSPKKSLVAMSWKVQEYFWWFALTNRRPEDLKKAWAKWMGRALTSSITSGAFDFEFNSFPYSFSGFI